MNLLFTIVRNIALLVLISSFWELLAPRGSLRGPVRLVIGLLLVSCVVLPITDALARGPEPWQMDLPEQHGAEQSLAAGQEISGRMRDDATKSYENDMARQVAAMCLLSDEVRQARAAVEADSGNGALKRVVVEAELRPGADAATTREKLTQMISTFFSVDEAVIECGIKEEQLDGTEQGAGQGDATDKK